MGWYALKPKPTQIIYLPAAQPITSAPQVVQLTPPAPTSVQQAKTEVTAEDPLQKKSVLLDTILASKNDNDPRLDTDFKNLNEDEKSLLQKKYAQRAKEKLNERGTLIFLLGRETDSYSDLTFIKQAVLEQPCNNMNNCESTEEVPKDEHAVADQITLVYPQVMALKSLELILKSPDKGPSLKNYAQEIVFEASKSRNTTVSSVAQKILETTAN